MDYKRKAKLTLPLLSLNRTTVIHFKVTGKCRQVNAEGNEDGGRGAMIVYPGINLDTGEEMSLLAFAVVHSVFLGLGDDLIGKSFELALKKEQTKGYKEVEIYEIEPEEEAKK